MTATPLKPDPDPVQKIEDLHARAIHYTEQGQFDLAEPLFQQALLFSQRELGEEHPLTAESLYNLALHSHKQKKLDLAEPLFQQALAIRRKVLGEEHLDTAHCLNDLAVLS